MSTDIHRFTETISYLCKSVSICGLERFHKCYRGVLFNSVDSGLFGFCPAAAGQKSKILAAHCYIISVNALN